MNGRYVTYEIRERIAIVTINNPPMNALSEETRDDLQSAFDHLNEVITDIRAVILTGTGDKAFIAGADIKVFPTLNPETAKARLKRNKERYYQIERFPHPVICAINGYCLGGGLELAMCCDIRIAADHAKLGQPEVNLGVIPGSGGTQRLARLVGEGIAKELIFTGRLISAEEAMNIGLVNKVVPKETLLNEVQELGKLLADKPPLALMAAKETIHRGLNMNLDEGLDLEIDRWSALCATEDQKEGARAFLEKRKPVFKGR
jgi:enoyl-CoA hydratase/carnithine racemase